MQGHECGLGCAAQVLKGGFSMMLRHRLHCTIVRGECHLGNGCAAGDGEQSAALIPDIGPDEHEV
jgi:hypothetical protein